ncbi:MAG: division/cell wall cluster transcriptional repressor MraZ [Oscillospiraceae bacterium]|nr:division/cell wall cluster transcriptional repressor MraZ [Oscillospiraceae bacterium]
MQGMYGTYQHSLDAKGRIFIPARLRDELGKEFIVTLSPERCLTAYSNAAWDRILENINSMSRFKQKQARPLFANAVRCEPDSQGRILLPQSLRDEVGLVKNVTVVGVGDTAQLWDAETYTVIEEQEKAPENINRMYEELDI